MEMKICLFLMLFVTVFFASSTRAVTWDQTNCILTTDDLKIIDVSSLHKNDSYYVVPDANPVSTGYNYLYNFCPSLGKSVGACAATDVTCQQSKSTPTTAYQIGISYTAGSATYSNGVTTLKFSGGIRTTTVNLNCNPTLTGEPTIIANEPSANQYVFSISHACCCVGFCGSAISSTISSTAMSTATSTAAPTSTGITPPPEPSPCLSPIVFGIAVGAAVGTMAVIIIICLVFYFSRREKMIIKKYTKLESIALLKSKINTLDV